MPSLLTRGEFDGLGEGGLRDVLPLRWPVLARAIDPVIHLVGPGPANGRGPMSMTFQGLLARRLSGC